MCGICCLVSFSDHPPNSSLLKEDLLYNLRRRGPSSSQELVKSVPHFPYHCFFSGHVLHIRGQITPQPVEDLTSDNVLLWNGEVFGGIPMEADKSDTEVIFHQLCSCSSESDILSVLSSIQGPWSLIFYQASQHCLWFGRDFFGRRSLLWQFNKELDHFLTLTSVSAISDRHWGEVPASGIFKMNLQNCAKAVILTLHQWKYPSRENTTEGEVTDDLKMISKYLPIHVSLVINESHSLTAPVVPLNKEVRNMPEESQILSFLKNIDDVQILQMFLAQPHKKKIVHQFIDVLSRAVERRVSCLVRDTDHLKGDVSGTALRKTEIAILFSGGVDSILLAILADRHVPVEEPIDLLNVAFAVPEQGSQNCSTRKHSKEKKQFLPGSKCFNANNVVSGNAVSPFNVPDRITGRAGLEELKSINPSRLWNFVEINVTLEELKAMRQQHIRHLVYPLDTVLDDSIGCAVWFASRGEGLITNRGDRRPYKSPAKVQHFLLTCVVCIHVL